jgi:3D (Asp-Asp-Asp) domain-containing protein
VSEEGGHEMTSKFTIFTSAVMISAVLMFPIKGKAALGDQMLSKGMKNEDVRELQEYLLTKSVFPYPSTTGYFGPITDGAVKKFQTQHDLKVDGIAGPQTISNIKILRFGDIGRPVTKLQRSLQGWGYYKGPIDGIYGKGTKNAVLLFQRDKQLKQDGIAGPQTFKKLNERAVVTKQQVKELTVTSTAYTANCKGCSGITKMGMDLKKYPNGKVVAVDPNVIPLGSIVEVEGYGKAIAGDIGGGIKGNEIDVFIPNENNALQWGKKNVKIRVYE